MTGNPCGYDGIPPQQGVTVYIGIGTLILIVILLILVF